MQKKIIALAIAGLVSGGAFAQSNVTISGTLNAQYGSMSATGATLGGAVGSKEADINLSSRGRMTENASEVRFSGEEKLGNGMTAFFTIGAALDPNGFAGNAPATGGAGILGSRNTAVGIKGDWGSVMTGKWDVHYSSQAGVDGFFANSGLQTSSLAILHGIGIGGTTTGAGGRLDNVLAYTTPNFSGFDMLVGYARPNEQPNNTYTNNALGVPVTTASVSRLAGNSAVAVGATDFGASTMGGAVAGTAANAEAATARFNLTGQLTDKKMSGWTLNPRYSNGPITAFYSHLRVVNAPVSTLSFQGVSATNGNTYLLTFANVVADLKANRLGGAYTFPMGLKLGLIWDKTRYDVNMGNVNTDGHMERTAWVLPVSYTTGAHTFAFTYGKTSNLKTSAGDVASSAAKYNMLGYNYAMSKRTSVNVAWSQIRNDANAAYDFFANSGLGMNAGNNGADPQSFNVGMKHTF